MPTAPAKKEVGYFSAMPADGMTAAHSPGEDFGTSRSKRQLFKGYAISRALERRLIAASYGSQPCLDGRHPPSPQVYPLDMRLICPNRNERQPQRPLCRFMVSSPLFGTPRGPDADRRLTPPRRAFLWMPSTSAIMPLGAMRFYSR